MGATAFLTLFGAIFLAFAQASKLESLAPIARNFDCHNGTGYGCPENYADAHLKRAVDVGECRWQLKSPHKFGACIS